MKTTPILRGLTIVLFAVSAFLANAQTEYSCAGSDISGSEASDCTPSSSNYMNYYRLQESYIPDNDAVALKTIKVNYHIIRKTDGTGNYQDIQATRDAFEQMTIWVNAYYQYNASPWDPITGVVSLSDAKVRLVHNEVYFYDSDALYTTNNPNLLINSTVNSEESAKCLNIFLNNCAYLQGLGSGMATSYTSSGGIKGSCVITIAGGYDPGLGNTVGPPFAFSSHLAHEVGHTLGLGHTYPCAGTIESINPSHIDFLEDVIDLGLSFNVACFGYTYSGPLRPAIFDCNQNDIGRECSNNLMGGTKNNGYSSPLQQGRIHRTLSLVDLNWPTGLAACGYADEPMEITQSETWDFDFKVYQNIVVKSGNILTVQCTLRMVPDALIIVEQGAKLVIDGGVITNGCYDQMWQGIEVIGSGGAQTYNGGTGLYSNQGFLEMKNGAIVENALTGVSAMEGGVVKAENSVFRNNQFAVRLGYYFDYTSHSRFINCVFETTRNLYQSSTFYGFATLTLIQGVYFGGNTFQNSNAGAASTVDLGYGIYAEDANFSATGTCSILLSPGQTCPEINLDRNLFINLMYGIRAQKLSTNYTYLVRQNSFQNCVTGVMNEGVNNGVITQNNFTVGESVPASALVSLAIGFNTGTGFQVEENFIESSPNPTSYFVYGININNSGTQENKVNNNVLENLHVALSASGVNWAGGGTNKRGLKFECNTMSGSIIYDIGVFSDQDPNTSDGVRYVQGVWPPSGNKVAAGNVFTNSGNNPYSDFYNQPGNSMRYLCLNTGDEIIYGSPSVLNESTLVFSANCGGGSNLLLSPQEENAIVNEIEELYDKLEAKKIERDSLLDNGNTGYYQELSSNLNPYNADWVYGLLSELSPYLSEKVLDSLAKIPDAPTSLILEMAMQNPDASNRGEFLQAMEERIEDENLEWTDSLLASWKIITQRTLLDVEISDIELELYERCHFLNRAYLLDSNTGNDSVYYQTISHMPDYESLTEMAVHFLSVHDWNSLDSVLALLENYGAARNLPHADNSVFISYISFLKNAYMEGKSVYHLDSLDLIGLESFAGNLSAPLTSVLAQNILMHYGYPYNYVPYLHIPNPNYEAKLSPNSISTEFEVFPNPASQELNIAWKNVDDSPQMEASIWDVQGKCLGKFTLSGKQGKEVYKLNQIPSGLYFLHIRNFISGESMEHLQFIKL